MGNPPLPALAVEVLWYGYEKKLNEFLNIPYSPFIIRLQQLSASIGDNNIYKAPPIPKIFPNPLTGKDLQDAKHRMIAQLIKYQIMEFETVYGNHDKAILPRRLEELDWSNELFSNALIDFYGSRNDQIELNTFRVRAWQAGARWRHAESDFVLET
ncbi:e341c9fa-a9d1-4cdd-aeea-e239d023dbb5 [Sclerotinia trifoliorum]|uniref:E341c9fa-a9d1-4cdd-aeea-e239d023dbb5 n=1 Tax=Sclerotinia trifoliorum TaxID=28548 RepID=A0A8H2W4E4_9HELO|nr:e341c9fa-a9d1-4cdd-aeea-e239d023dbb5 [Sclerotinia trifoliorum]